MDEKLKKIANSRYQIDTSEEIKIYIEKNEKLQQNLLKMRSKVKELRTTQIQYLSLLKKSIEGYYGENEIIDKEEPTVEPSNSQTLDKLLNEFSKVISSDSLSLLTYYMNLNSVIETQLFEKMTIFNSKSEKAIAIASPSMRVTLYDSIIQHVQSCHQFLNTLIPMLSNLGNSEAIDAILTKANGDNHYFFKFYNNTLKTITEMVNAQRCIILFAPPTQDQLIYPTENYNYILPLEKTLSGQLYSQHSICTVDFPLDEYSYDTVRENCVFLTNDKVMSCPFSLEFHGTGGMLLFFKDEFSMLDKSFISMICNYLSPIFFLFRSVFIQVAPRHFSLLGKAISSFRIEKELVNSIQRQFCNVGCSEKCRVLLLNEDKENLKNNVFQTLPEGKSLIRSSIEYQQVSTYLNPRKLPDFNPSIDDEPSLQKITSMLVLNVKESNFVIVLYNSLISTNFSPLQSSLVTLFSTSLPPIIHQIALRQEVDEISQNNIKQKESKEKAFSYFQKLVSIFAKGKFKEDLNTIFTDGVNVQVGYAETIESGEEEEKKTIFLDLFTDEQIEKLEDLNLFDGLTSIYQSDEKRFIVSNSNYLCIFDYKKMKTEFDENMKDFLLHIAYQFFIIAPSSINRFSLNELKSRDSLVYQMSTGSINAFSKFIDLNVSLISKEEFEKNEKSFTYSLKLENIDKYFVTKSEDVKDIQKEYIEKYAKWYDKYLKIEQENRAKTDVSEIVDFFEVVGFNHFFNCEKEDMIEFFSRSCSFFADHGIDMMSREKALKFTQSLLNDNSWVNWFTTEQRLVIYLLVFFYNLPKYFSFTPNEEITNIIENKKKQCHPFIALIFGIYPKITEKTPNEKKQNMVDLLELFSFDDSITDISHIYGSVRIISTKTFQTLNTLNPNIAKAVILISLMFPFLNRPNQIIETFNKAYSEEETKKIIYLVERMLMPILTFMCQKNEMAMNILNLTRTSLREIKK